MSGFYHVRDCLYHLNCGGFLETAEQELSGLCVDCMDDASDAAGRAPNGHRDTIVPAPAPHKKRPQLGKGELE